MSLLAGDLTTPWRAAVWLANAPALPSPIISQLIGSMTGLIYGKLNRARTFSQTFTRTFDGVGNMQLVLPDYPVTSVVSVQNGNAIVPPSVLPTPPGSPQPIGTNSGYGYRLIPWDGNLPGTNATLEFAGGYFYTGAQSVRVVYRAGYLVSGEASVVPSSSPWQITALQQEGIWCRDNGVSYAATGISLIPVSTITSAGQYIPPPDSSPGVYTFGTADQNAAILISYSFIPAPLEEACIQMVAERMAYRGRIGEISKSLGGQESVRFSRDKLPPEVMALIHDYVSVVYPLVGAPV